MGFESLLITPISKSSAIQRCGRAGREAPGKCFRLYTQTAFEQLEDRTAPEILRANIASTLLTIKAHGVQNPFEFGFLSRPSYKAVLKGLENLYQLSALDKQGQITSLGKRMSKLPVAPSLAKTLLEAASKSVLSEVIDIVSMLSVDNVFLDAVDDDEREVAMKARRQLEPLGCPGDHVLLLSVLRAFIAEPKGTRRAWCDSHRISLRNVSTALDIRKQLFSLVAGRSPHEDDAGGSVSNLYKDILQCFIGGFPTQIARLCTDGKYRTVFGNQDISVHPSSSVWASQKRATLIIYSECIYTTKTFARWVSSLEEGWL